MCLQVQSHWTPCAQYEVSIEGIDSLHKLYRLKVRCIQTRHNKIRTTPCIAAPSLQSTYDKWTAVHQAYAETRQAKTERVVTPFRNKATVWWQRDRSVNPQWMWIQYRYSYFRRKVWNNRHEVWRYISHIHNLLSSLVLISQKYKLLCNYTECPENLHFSHAVRDKTDTS